MFLILLAEVLHVVDCAIPHANVSEQRHHHSIEPKVVVTKHPHQVTHEKQRKMHCNENLGRQIDLLFFEKALDTWFLGKVLVSASVAFPFDRLFFQVKIDGRVVDYP